MSSRFFMMVSFTRAVALLLATLVASVTAYAPLQGVKVTSVSSGQSVDLGDYLSSPSKNDGSRSMLVLGTYAADFNAIEYAQRLRYYAPKLKECGVSKFGLVLNCNPDAAKSLAEAVELDTDTVELLVDPSGEAGRTFGVERGWRPDDEEMSPFLKLFAMLWGLGAWATLPAVIGGYIGNPWFGQPWIEDALAVGQRQGRWPGNALEIADDGTITNKFEELPVVGEWKRRPLELATLRLQNMIGISLRKWKELAPDDEALKAGVLTQLGACVVVDSSTGEELFRWRDPGICAVANFEDILKELGAEPGEPVEDQTVFVEVPPTPVQSAAVDFSTPVDTAVDDLSIPYDAAARLAYEGSDKAMEYDAFKAKYESDAVADVVAKQAPKQDSVGEKATANEPAAPVEAEVADLSVPYDAAARLAYEASDKAMEYDAFKAKYESDAVADVVAKQAPKQESVGEKVTANEPTAPVETEVAELSVPYDAAARLAYEASDKAMEYDAFKTKYESDAVADVVAKQPPKQESADPKEKATTIEPTAHAEAEVADLSIPYDAAARLAYEASDKEMEYDAFKVKYESDAVADVVAKQEPKQESADTAEKATANDPTVHAETGVADLSIPYDAAARLAYEASYKAMEYDAFKAKYEADAVADVIAKTADAAKD